MVSDAKAIAEHVRLFCDQMSIFAAISAASSTSMPGYLTVLSVLYPSKSCTARQIVLCLRDKNPLPL